MVQKLPISISSDVFSCENSMILSLLDMRTMQMLNSEATGMNFTIVTSDDLVKSSVELLSKVTWA